MDEEQKYMLIDALLPVACNPEITDSEVNAMIARGMTIINMVNALGEPINIPSAHNEKVAEEIKAQLLLE